MYIKYLFTIIHNIDATRYEFFPKYIHFKHFFSHFLALSRHSRCVFIFYLYLCTSNVAGWVCRRSLSGERRKVRATQSTVLSNGKMFERA